MTIERLLMSLQTVKENIAILESQQPEDAGYLLQLEHERHIRDLLEAEVDGRLVVLPCRVGTPVYVVGERRIMKCDTYEIRQDNVSGLEYLLSFECDDDCDGCPFNSWHQDYSGEYSCHGEWGEWCVKGAEFGKTVFLTPEEAESALANGGDPDA